MSARSRRFVSRRRPRNRRGVILLVVLSLLVLFTLIAITFVILATQHKKTARAAERPLRYDDGYAELLTRAAMQALRGTDNPMSIIGHHSLLEDLYGNDSVAATIIPDLGGGIPGFALANQFGYAGGSGVATLTFIDVQLPSANPASTFRPVAGYYNGRVLTMLTGPAAGKSTRIVAYSPVDLLPAGMPDGTEETGRIVILPFEGMSVNTSVAPPVWNLLGAPVVGDRFLINGRPFNGAGFGHNPLNGQLDAADGLTVGPSNRQFALLPFPPSPFDTTHNPVYQNYLTSLGGANGVSPDEDYDAVDFQNMLLAGRIWSGARWEVRLPSLVRPELINYWAKRYIAAGNDPTVPATAAELLQRTFPRPLPITGFGHINFSGSNPAFDSANLTTTFADFSRDELYSGGPTNGVLAVMEKLPWDVDNDGDGVPDSVWVDLGMPVQTAPDGRRYKPLFALLVLDMDARVNLNAHGTPYHTREIAGAGTGVVNEEYVFQDQNQVAGNMAGGAGYTSTPTVTLPAGMGASVAEVNPGAVLQQPYLHISPPGTITINELRRLMQGGFPINPATGDPDNTLPYIEGRYGEGDTQTMTYMNSLAANDSPPTGRPPMAGETTTLATTTWVGPDNTPTTADDVTLYDGDDNRPVPPVAAVSGSGRYFAGNYIRDSYFAGVGVGNNGSPIDLDGNGALFLDLNGQPTGNYLAGGWGTSPVLPEGLDEPFEIDLFRQAMRAVPGGTAGQQRWIDRPFTPGELESLLRFRDADARTFPRRITQLAPATANNPLFQGLLTTESWDLPSPPVRITPELLRLRNGPDGIDLSGDEGAQSAVLRALLPSTTNLGLADLLAARIIAGMNPQPVPPFTAAQEQIVNFSLAQMLAPELAAGLKLDINRPLGDGVDNNGNGAIDEPGEALFPESIWNNSGTSPGAQLFDHNNDGDGNLPMDAYRTDLQARQTLARQLYVMMMLLTDSGYALLARTATADSGLTPAQRRELTVRRIAQWAVNVVDFRDRDSIMTPFEYDADPFTDGTSPVDGYPWDVDGWVGNNPLTGTTDDALSTNTQRRLVWGCESPELLITETLATHDRRTTDLATPGGTFPMDQTFDQQKIPIGSAFVELYCTRNPNNPALQGDLYRANGFLDLGKMSLATPSGAQYPVWRLAVSYGRLAEGNGKSPHWKKPYKGKGKARSLWKKAGDWNDVATRVRNRPLSSSLQPDDFNLLTAANVPNPITPVENPVEIERIVWFSSFAPHPATVEIEKIYYNFGPGAGAGPTDVLLGAGQYAVVGPYQNPSSGPENVTTFGDSAVGNLATEIWLGDGAAASGAGGRSPVTVYNRDPGGEYPAVLNAGTGEIQTPLGIAVAGDPAGTDNETANGWDTPIRFSVSEPLFSDDTYYPKPDDTTNTTTIAHHDGTSSQVVDRYLTPEDVPLDQDPEVPMGQNDYYRTGTHQRYRSVFLQRLADPTLPWNPSPFLTDGTANPDYVSGLSVNPYIAVDWAPFDLTVFNGEPNAANDPDTPPGGGKFGTRQRGSDTVGSYDLWKQPDWLNAATVPPNAAPEADNLRHTLGYINLPYHNLAMPVGERWITSANLPAGYPPVYIGAPMAPSTNGSYIAGAPFPWLTWNNRPYVSAMELLQVPASSAGRLLFEFDWRHGDVAGITPGNFVSHYNDTNATGTQGPAFRHLLNLGYTSNNDLVNNDPTTQGSATARGNYHRVLDYVGVPSRFSGTEEMLNPGAIWGNGVNSLPFHPPFNRVSKYREPGKININTILDSGQTWNAIMNGNPGSGLLWNKVVASRRGYGVSAPIVGLRDDESPTLFSNPFRSNNYNYPELIPALRNRNQGASGMPPFGANPTQSPSPPTSPTGYRRSVESGLFRPDPDDPDRPLFAVGTLTQDAAPWSLNTEPFRDADRNAYFRFKELQKLDNMLTTRSNVYAIWITVGYFEVTPVTPSVYHPDGYTLGAEIGSDSGDIKRHRAFFLFDRSIPVAFQRGYDHNVQKALLIQRIIE